MKKEPEPVSAADYKSMVKRCAVADSVLARILVIAKTREDLTDEEVRPQVMELVSEYFDKYREPSVPKKKIPFSALLRLENQELPRHEFCSRYKARMIERLITSDSAWTIAKATAAANLAWDSYGADFDGEPEDAADEALSNA